MIRIVWYPSGAPGREKCSLVFGYMVNNGISLSFCNEKQMAMKYFAAHTRAQRMGVTADVMVRDSQASAGFWEVTRDALADLVRIQLLRCYDDVNYPELYKAVRGLRGDVWLCAFPNFIYYNRTEQSGSFRGRISWSLMLTVYLRVRTSRPCTCFIWSACIWAFLANRWGCRSVLHVYFYVSITS